MIDSTACRSRTVGRLPTFHMGEAWDVGVARMGETLLVDVDVGVSEELGVDFEGDIPGLGLPLLGERPHVGEGVGVDPLVSSPLPLLGEAGRNLDGTFNIATTILSKETKTAKTSKNILN
jgi:hypothetical protein